MRRFLSTQMPSSFRSFVDLVVEDRAALQGRVAIPSIQRLVLLKMRQNSEHNAVSERPETLITRYALLLDKIRRRIDERKSRFGRSLRHD